VAHGNNSVLADRIALKLADYVVTESGFGADCGAEKLFDIVCRQSGLKVDCAVITLSIRALKLQGGAYEFRPGQKYDREKAEKLNMPALEKGCGNLRVHIENVRQFGIPVVVTINLFSGDHDEEIDFVRKYAVDNGAAFAVPIEAWASGGAGCTEAAEAIVKACDMPNNFHTLYPDDMTIKQKIETIATKVYRAEGVDYSPLAEKRIKLYEELGLGKLCINVAKTQYSITHDPNLLCVPPAHYRVPVRDVRCSAGAGFLYPLLGEMNTMPGLPKKAAFMDVDIDKDGKTVGLF
jgi:formate--tetrahydrofolate ligase